VVPVSGALFAPEVLGEYGALLWLAALVPAFLLAYYRGWRGVATALAIGMATLSCTQAVATWLGRSVPDLLLGVVVVYLFIALGIGWLAEVMHRDRDEVEDLAFTDLLTHLPNRRHARVFLENEFAAAERGRLLSLILFDLDHFKSYNDRYGHQAGDEALKEFSDILARTTRRMNLSARYGGEEFVAILAGSDAEGAMVFAERVRTALREVGLGDPPLTVSAGVAAHHASMRSPDELLAAADHALYQAKREGRNCSRLFGETGLRPEPEPDAPAGAAGSGDAGLPPDPARGEPDPDPDDPTVSLLSHQVTGFGAGRRILLVEDEAQVRALIASYLEREGFAVIEAADASQGIRALGDEFDAIITDIQLPGAAGDEVVTAAKARWPRTQVIVITGLQDAQVAAAALKAGADRYLFKPFGMPELRSHLSDALTERESANAPPARAALSPAQDARARAIRASVLRGAGALVRAAELRDPHTRGHGEAVARFAAVLAPEVDPDRSVLDPALLPVACEFLDIGKIGIPDRVLNKAEALTPAERDQVREHPRTGERILEPLISEPLVLDVVRGHHERWDGGGYPEGLAGDAIPLAARVVAVADALAAMTRPRAFRPALSWAEAMEELAAGSGRQFDPRVVAAALAREERLRAEAELLAEERPPAAASEGENDGDVADDPAQG
jgi:diguanylate cyclase (GGDEF)-like protein